MEKEKISTNQRDIHPRDQFVYRKDQENYSVFTEVTKKMQKNVWRRKKYHQRDIRLRNQFVYRSFKFMRILL